MKTFKRVITCMACTALTAMAFIPTTSAANTADTRFNFMVPAAGYYTVVGPGRAKTNTSSVYINYQNGPTYGTLFSAHGGYNSSKAVRNCTVGDSAQIVRGTQRRLRSNIKEWGYSYAFIGGANHDYTGATLTGLWSPDCAGNYPAAN